MGLSSFHKGPSGRTKGSKIEGLRSSQTNNSSNSSTNDKHTDDDKEDMSLERWTRLLERTQGMRSLAEKCLAVTSHSVGKDVLSSLDNIKEFIKCTESPDYHDFKYVDLQMQVVNKLVGEAVDKFIQDKRGRSTGFYQRVFSITKIVAVCLIVLGILTTITEFSSLPRS